MLDPKTGEITFEGDDCPHCKEHQRQAIELERSLRDAEFELRKLRREAGRLRAELGKQTAEAPEMETAKAIGKYWISRCDKDRRRTKLGDKRMSAVIARLRDGYTPAYIARAIDGLAEYAYEDGGVKYDDLELVCRNEVNLERYYKKADVNLAQTLISPAWLREVGGDDDDRS